MKVVGDFERLAEHVFSDRRQSTRVVLRTEHHVSHIVDFPTFGRAERRDGVHVVSAAIVQPIRIASEDGLWKVVDVRVIDGAVNGVGEIVKDSGEVIRRVQSGSVRTYAASLLLGVVFILGYYLWR